MKVPAMLGIYGRWSTGFVRTIHICLQTHLSIIPQHRHITGVTAGVKAHNSAVVRGASGFQKLHSDGWDAGPIRISTSLAQRKWANQA
jgi:hypothetical protein